MDAAPHGADRFDGVVFVPGTYRRTKADIGRIAAALAAILAQHPGEHDLADGEAWL